MYKLKDNRTIIDADKQYSRADPVNSTEIIPNAGIFFTLNIFFNASHSHLQYNSRPDTRLWAHATLTCILTRASCLISYTLLHSVFYITGYNTIQ
jgi:hypothetical protein